MILEPNPTKPVTCTICELELKETYVEWYIKNHAPLHLHTQCCDGLARQLFACSHNIKSRIKAEQKERDTPKPAREFIIP